ncbi:MAG TPA: hypothetical protein VMW73_02190 [Spirochaetia bacterium]|nr:hypothetical protein [Spirochaetia bacterium]
MENIIRFHVVLDTGRSDNAPATTQVFEVRGYLVLAVSIGEEALDVVGLDANITHCMSGSSRQFFADAPNGNVRTTSEGRPLDQNPAMARMPGAAVPTEMLEKQQLLSRDLYAEPGHESRRAR